LELRPCNDDEL